MPDLELRANGEVFTRWESVSVTRSIEQLASTFSIQSRELRSANNGSRPINAGDICSVWVGTHRLIAGYVDRTVETFTADTNRLEMSGRSTLADVVDCSAVVESGSLKNQTLQQIAETLCSPFGVGVVMQTAAPGVFRRFAIQEGERVGEAITRAAKARGLSVFSDDEGNLVIATAGVTRAETALVAGQNILRGSVSRSMTERFSSYTVKGQTAASDEWAGRTATQIQGTATDPEVTRHRPFVMIAEAQIENDGANTRAAWERNNRRARGFSARYTVRGWQDGSGVWTPNRIVSVTDAARGVSGEYLIVEAVMTKSEQGELTELTLAEPEAYTNL